MMVRTMMAVGVAMVMLSLGTTWGAQPGAKPEEKVELTGVIEMVMAIGGDTTGLVLRTTTADGKAVMQEISGDPKVLGKMMNKKVKVTGHYYEKKYVERGTVKILEVEKVEEVK